MKRYLLLIISVFIMVPSVVNAKEYCDKGDILGVKGRVQSRVVEKDGKKEYLMDIVAEKITFLSSKKGEEAE